jgi:hypothetical protein
VEAKIFYRTSLLKIPTYQFRVYQSSFTSLRNYISSTKQRIYARYVSEVKSSISSYYSAAALAARKDEAEKHLYAGTDYLGKSLAAKLSTEFSQLRKRLNSHLEYTAKAIQANSEPHEELSKEILKHFEDDVQLQYINIYDIVELDLKVVKAFFFY